MYNHKPMLYTECPSCGKVIPAVLQKCTNCKLADAERTVAGLKHEIGVPEIDYDNVHSMDAYIMYTDPQVLLDKIKFDDRFGEWFKTKVYLMERCPPKRDNGFDMELKRKINYIEHLIVRTKYRSI